MRIWLYGSSIAAMVCAYGVLAADTPKKGKERPALTSDLMAGLVQPSCAAVGKELKAESPDWTVLRRNAALLSEASYILMEDGRCPSGDWAKAAKTLRECSASVLAKVDAKDAAGAKEAFGALTKSCAACHEVHKEKS